MYFGKLHQGGRVGGDSLHPEKIVVEALQRGQLPCEAALSIDQLSAVLAGICVQEIHIFFYIHRSQLFQHGKSDITGGQF